jgi:hypothetical protein
MATTIEWEGHKIEMKCFLSPKYLMTATESVLFVDGNKVGNTGGFHFTESAIGDFLHNGKSTKIELEIRGGIFTLSNVDYVLRIAGVPISYGKLNIERIGLGCLFWIIIGAAIAALIISLVSK